MIEPLSKGSLWQEKALASTMLEMVVCAIFMVEHAKTDAVRSVCIQVLMSMGTLACGAVSDKHALLLAPIVVLLDWMRSHALYAFSEFWDAFVDMYNILPHSPLASSAETSSLPLQEELELLGFSYVSILDSHLNNVKDLDMLSSLKKAKIGLGSTSSRQYLAPASPQEQLVLAMTNVLVLFI